MISHILNSIRSQVSGCMRLGLPVPKYVLIHASHDLRLDEYVRSSMSFNQNKPTEIQGLKIIYNEITPVDFVLCVPELPNSYLPQFLKHEENPAWKNVPYMESPGPWDAEDIIVSKWTRKHPIERHAALQKLCDRGFRPVLGMTGKLISYCYPLEMEQEIKAFTPVIKTLTMGDFKDVICK